MTGPASPASPPAAPEAAILGRLLLIQQTLDVMGDAEHMAGYLSCVLVEIPGVAGAHFCLDGRVHPPHEAYRLALAKEISGYRAGAPLEGQPDTFCLPLRRAHRLFGLLVLRLADREAFAPYEPFVANTANVMATTLETRDALTRLAASHHQLQRVAGDLEERVTARTVQLLTANAELRSEVGERRRVEAALRESEAKYRRYVDGSPVAIFVINEGGRYLDVNPAACELTGFDREELLSMTILDLSAPRAIAKNMAGAAELFQSGRASSEVELRHKDGSSFEATLDAVRLDGLRYIGFCQDISARKQAERELVKLSRAVELAPVSIVITDLDANIEYVNAAFTRVTGFTAAEVVGQNPRMLQSGDTPREAYLDMWATLTRGAEWRGVFHNRKKSGEPYWEHAVVLPVVNGEGQIKNYLAIKEDITARRAAQQALTQLNADLERRVFERTAELSHAARAKDEFLATMSHELRTPLNAVLGFSEALQEGVYGALSEPQHTALRKVEESGRHLLSLINDILDLSKVEAGKVSLDLAPVNVPDLCRASMQLVQGMARAKRQRAVLAVDDLSGALLADERRLKQILVNLLSNAVKFTPDAGEVGLEVGPTRDGESLQFTVWDTGIGISPEQVPQLFKPFVQLDSSLSRHHTGTGLGLSLVRGLCELHGGGVEVESVLGQGSRFTVRLPRRGPPGAA